MDSFQALGLSGIPGPVLLSILHAIKILNGTPVLYECSLRQIWESVAQAMQEMDPYTECRFKRYRQWLQRAGPRFLVLSEDGGNVLYHLNLLACMLHELSVHITEDAWDSFSDTIMEIQRKTNTSAAEVQELQCTDSALTCQVDRTAASSSSLDSIDSRDTLIFSQLQTIDSMLDDNTGMQDQLTIKRRVIFDLREQKKKMLQKIRRLSHSLDKAKQQKSEYTSNTMSLERVGADSNGKKWRWLTPTGCVNAAAPWRLRLANIFDARLNRLAM